MARNGRGTGLDQFIDVLVDEIGARLSSRVEEIVGSAAGRRGRGGARGGARRKIDMRCRYPGCKNRSKGPRFRFLCEEHLKLPKKEQDAALAKAAEKRD
jgi:hypothetical protein